MDFATHIKEAAVADPLGGLRPKPRCERPIMHADFHQRPRAPCERVSPGRGERRAWQFSGT